MTPLETTAIAHKPTMISMIRPVVTSAFFFMLITGIAYPLITTGVSQVILPMQAQGSLIYKDSGVTGSHLIGQSFTQARYFHGRPSVTTHIDPTEPTQSVDKPYNAAASAGSNQGVLSTDLLADVSKRATAYREENGLAANTPIPADAVTASASGLDPDISPANAQLQADRVAKARGRHEQEILNFLSQHITPRQFGILGEPRINVLELNLALDAAWPTSQN